MVGETLVSTQAAQALRAQSQTDSPIRTNTLDALSNDPILTDLSTSADANAQATRELRDIPAARPLQDLVDEAGSDAIFDPTSVIIDLSAAAQVSIDGSSAVESTQDVGDVGVQDSRESLSANEQVQANPVAASNPDAASVALGNAVDLQA